MLIFDHTNIMSKLHLLEKENEVAKVLEIRFEPCLSPAFPNIVLHFFLADQNFPNLKKH